MIGQSLGPYHVLARLGEGGMGEVYRARDTRLQRDVAIKALPDTFAAHSERLARFEREAQVLASLNHPHIAQTMEAPVSHQRGQISIGAPVRVVPASGQDFLPSADGRRFLLMESAKPRSLALVNWQSLLAAK